MRQRELVRLLKSLGQLTHAQRQKVMAELGTSERQAASVAIVEGSVSVKPNCPHCGGEHVVRNGVAHDLQRYKCRDCRKTFNALTGTPLARLRMKFASPRQMRPTSYSPSKRCAKDWHG